MKVLFEARNLLKEMSKGTFVESSLKSTFNFVNPTSGNSLTSKQDKAWEFEIMCRVLTKDSNCIDIGCNMGDFLSSMIQLAPLGYHYAFEPIPRLARRLKKRFPNTDVKPIALTDLEEKTTFWYVVNSPGLSSLNKQVCYMHSPNGIIEPITVKAQKLDDILTPDFKIHLIKVDVEGAELQVFRGAIRTLKTHQPYILFEHGKIDVEKGHDDRVYDLLVNQCNLKIFELKSWLEDLDPLGPEEFAKSSSWNFLATP